MRTTAYLGLGSNLGDRAKFIDLAINKIGQLKDTEVAKVSTIVESVAVGGPVQPDYLNGVMEIGTGLSCRQLLMALQTIEKELGRLRSIKNGPRTIDLDILFFGDSVINEPDLAVPHPRIKERSFVLGPLKEIAPDIAARIE